MSERVFVAKFVRRLGQGAYPALCPPHGMLLREVDCYRGRVDIIRAVFPRPPKGKALRGIGHILVQPSAAATVAHVPTKGSRTIEELRQLTGYSLDILRQRVAELAANGLLAIGAAGEIRRGQTRLPAMEIWSFEAKLTKWRRALYQAMQYRGFSHRSFVVMPEAGASAALSNVRAFRTLGVGLLIVRRGGEIQRVVVPRSKKPFSGIHHHLAIGRVLSELPRAH